MVAKKRKSKRQTLQQKYKIQKRTKEHHRKLNKGATVGTGHKKKKVDHIPDAWPYKQELLKEIRAAKQKLEDLKQQKKEKKKEDKKNKTGTMEVESSVTSLQERNRKVLENALQSQAQENNHSEESEEDGDVDMHEASLGQNSRRAFLKELRKVVERADVILQVLDARDPQGTRSKAVADMILADHRKKLVYVLNKADLVPREVLVGWLAYLRKFHPTIPFKCNTQDQKGNLRISAGKADKGSEQNLRSNHAVGAEELMGLMKNYCRVGDSKQTITVGIVGFPNVGKSSLINSLMRARAVGVSSTPGFTRCTKEVILDKCIRLIDSPGIVFADGDSETTSLRNCVNVEDMEDVLTPVQGILNRCPQPYLMQLYSIASFSNNNVTNFLSLVAKATGKLKKGGTPNIDAAARSVLHDWNNGKIKYYCKPPKSVVNKETEKETQILTGFSKEIDVDSWEQADVRVLDALQDICGADDDVFLGIHVGDEDAMEED